MADAKKESETPPPAPVKAAPVSAASVSKKAAAEVKDVKTGFSLMRPVHYAKGFVGGTVNGTLDGTASWGRKGSMVGLAAGFLAIMSGVAAPAIGLLVLGWVGGLAVGAVTGGLVGVATGGIKGVGREQRKETYAEDLQARSKAKARPAPLADYRERYREHHVNNNYIVDRVLQQNAEVRQQEREGTHTFFQDMVHHSRQFNREPGL